MTKINLPTSSQELISRFLPDCEQRDDANPMNGELFQKALMNFHHAMMGKNEKQVYTMVFDACTVMLNSELPMVCNPSYKYKEVHICLADGWCYPIAKIKLSNTGRLIDDEKTYADTTKLGYEIARRWNAFIPKGGEE